MATAAKKIGVEEEVQVHRIRITLTSLNVKNLEKGEQQVQGAMARVAEGGPLIGRGGVAAAEVARGIRQGATGGP